MPLLCCQCDDEATVCFLNNFGQRGTQNRAAVDTRRIVICTPFTHNFPQGSLRRSPALGAVDLRKPTALLQMERRLRHEQSMALNTFTIQACIRQLGDERAHCDSPLDRSRTDHMIDPVCHSPVSRVRRRCCEHIAHVRQSTRHALHRARLSAACRVRMYQGWR